MTTSAYFEIASEYWDKELRDSRVGKIDDATHRIQNMLAALNNVD